MTQYVFSRVVQALLAVVGVTMIVFVAARLSGDPVRLMVPLDSTPEQEAAIRARYGLDKPVWYQYGRFVANLARGDAGQSFRYHVPALSFVVERLPHTAMLAASAATITIVFSIPLGILAALKRGSAIDTLATLFSSLGQSAPSFWVATMAVLVFAVKLGWLPAVGAGSVKSLVLPAVTLGIFPIAVTMRLVRSTCIEVLGTDYVRTARAKGLAGRSVIVAHVLRNALLPIVTLFGLQCAGLLGGSVIVEQIFAWPGVGRLMSDAIFAKDFPLIQAGVLLLSVIFVFINLLTDLSYVLIDPRVKLQ